MNEARQDDFAVHSFLEEVEKNIEMEAPSDAWHQPRFGDVVTAELGSECYTWRVGSGFPLSAGGVELDRCVRTMRPGEHATFKPKDDEKLTPVSVRLVALERCEDLLGDGRLLRLTLGGGSGWQTPQPGTEICVRFAWRVAQGTQDEWGKPQTSGANTAAEMTSVLVNGPQDQRTEVATSRELGDLRRVLLRRFSGTVSVAFRDYQPSSVVPALSVTHGSQVIASTSTFGVGGVAELCSALDAHPEATPHADSRAVAMKVEEGQLSSIAEDWIPGHAGWRVLCDLRAKQRCLLRVEPDLTFGAEGLLRHGVPSEAALEYDVELVHITTIEDISLGSDGGVLKKTTRDGDGYERPTEGTEVKMKLGARDDASGDTLIEDLEITFSVGSGQYCPAVEETTLLMKKGEACEVQCVDVNACDDPELGLGGSKGGAVKLTLELLDFVKLDLYSLEEAERVQHCAKRKEVGTKFFQAGALRRALKRYQHVTNTLAYIDHWKDAAAKSEAISLRRVCHLNAAACWLKLEVWHDAERSCGLVLREEPENVKALFRRGRALKELGEYREAEQSLRKVLDFDKGNQDAARMLRELRLSVRSEVEQHKDMLSRMARGIGKANASPDTREGAREEQPTRPRQPASGKPPGGEASLVPSSRGFGRLAVASLVVVVVAAAGLVAQRWRAVGHRFEGGGPFSRAIGSGASAWWRLWP